MPAKLTVPLYALTLTLSAFLLFSVQPMFAKMILPLLGGSPSVWNIAMVFFQTMLLGGYAYAHGTSQFLNVRAQACVHIILLALTVFLLPLAIPAGASPPTLHDPAWWQLGIMLMAVGGPFFAVSASAPILQRWFSHTTHANSGDPYFLYGASNFGSMAALLMYPFVIEPFLTLQGQSHFWSIGFMALIALFVICSMTTKKSTVPARDKTIGSTVKPITFNQIAIWLLLAFIPSSLMLGVTTYITTDLASVPLLWIMPLSLYIGTFILVFARNPLFTMPQILRGQALLLILIILFQISGIKMNPFLIMGLHLGLFFMTALMCHTYLANLRPHAKHLTAFYLIMSLGGVLGGIFNALIAPSIFIIPVEYVLVLGISLFIRHMHDQSRPILKSKQSVIAIIIIALAACITASHYNYTPVMQTIAVQTLLGIADFILLAGLVMLIEKRWIFAVTAGVLLFINFMTADLGPDYKLLFEDRNFFGVIKVVDFRDQYRILLHGTTLHGAQSLNPKYQMTPLMYYYPDVTPSLDIFNVMASRPTPQKIGDIGLGIGSISCYKKPGRHIDFYEIDPDIGKVAENKKFFTFLSDCGTPYKLIFGDGRLQIDKAPDHSYDMIFLDAFSSDNIPAHLMTVEAFKIYEEKLAPHGLIAINISNRYLDLRPVVAANSRDLGMHAMFKTIESGKDPKTGLDYSRAVFAIISPDEKGLAPFITKYKGWKPYPLPADYKPWTDDFSNIISVLR